MRGTLEGDHFWYADYLQTMVSVYPTFILISSPLPEVDSGKTPGEST